MPKLLLNQGLNKGNSLFYQYEDDVHLEKPLKDNRYGEISEIFVPGKGKPANGCFKGKC